MPGANSEFRLEATKAVIPRDVGGEIERFDGVVPRLEFPLRFEWDPALGTPYKFTMKDQTPLYLAAPA